MMLLRNSVYQAMRRAILTCELQPGAELREHILAERYRVSRSPVRDALLRLEQESLVTVLPRRGYLVKPITITTIDDIIGLRLLIEPACAEAAAARADDTALRTLDRFRSSAAPIFADANSVELDETFHRSVAEMAGSKYLTGFASNMIEQFERVIRFVINGVTDELIHRDLAEHDALIDAIQNHHADCSHQLARAHVEAARDRVMTAFCPV